MNEKATTRPRRRKGHGRSRTSPAKMRPVPLHKRVSSHFERGDRQRGEEYFAQERARLQVEGTRLLARVEGTERESYGVGVDWSRIGDRVLHGFCECQRFADGKPCKHLWATLLAFDEGGFPQPPGRDRLSLRRDRGASWKDLGLAPADSAPQAGGSLPRRAHLARPSRKGPPPGPAAAGNGWRAQLAAVRDASRRFAGAAADEAPAGGPEPAEMMLLINTAASLGSGGLVLDVFARGGGGKLQRTTLAADQLEQLLQGDGRPGEPSEGASPVGLVTALPAEPAPRKGRGRGPHGKTAGARVQRMRLSPQLYEPVLPRLCSRGALGWWDGRATGEQPPLSWDEGQPWRLALRVQLTGTGTARLSGALERERESVPLSVPELILHGGPRAAAGAGGAARQALVVFGDTLARLEVVPARDLPWIGLLRGKGEMVVPREELGEALTELLELPMLPRLETPEGLELGEQQETLTPRLVLETDPAPAWTNPPLRAQLSFVYGEHEVDAGDPRGSAVDLDKGTFVRRDMEAERAALVRLLELGLRPVESKEGHGLELPPRELPEVAEPLLAEGWEVEVHGASLRPPSPPALRVESGIDWFELKGEVAFAGDRLEMADLLSAVSRGDRFVTLRDGSQGLLPASWMETYDSLAKLAQDATDDGLRFLPSQALLVDALLAATPPAQVDKEFASLREKLRSFDRVKPKKERASFGGTLRGYQREGLGWLEFLREFGLGGVLADDMGLGKTVQVLALLQVHRTPAKTSGLPWLVVAPRSLVYNWVEEARRFTPKLRVTEYHGADREELRTGLGDYDLVVTTYGTLRRDIGFLAKVEFDTVILDEAQAIKNPESQTAKAARLLVGRRRLALTGTPIENHLGELGSLFEFLNPGLLGRLPKLDVLASGGAPSEHQLALVAQGMRPFILRRTKAEVLEDLPDKTEQVLHCALRPQQRELYDRLRAQYQASLLEQVEAKGVKGATMQVLEALLRLRQVACHPGLVNPEWEEAGSAKLEALFDQVEEVLAEGHKALVFSQFTSLLAYVRSHLDGKGREYAYLDGQTRDRAAQVERFQTDPGCQLFLVSLKAGGVGLNLTAAEYVFLLDPWWNPAVEAQAIDRAHRIGQTRPVFAYRMIARDTVEEKMVELQRSKRQLADAVLGGEGQTLGEITADDLRMLLS